jgi:hypothetical protein
MIGAKVMKVKRKSISDDGCGRVWLLYVMAQRFKKHSYTRSNLWYHI